jgi:hypothetical protein
MIRVLIDMWENVGRDKEVGSGAQQGVIRSVTG